MAEMTAAAMVEWLTSDKAFGQECYSRQQIAALIQQQAATIEAQGRDIERLTNVYNVANRYIADGLFNVDFNYRQLEKALEIAKQQVREGLNDV